MDYFSCVKAHVSLLLRRSYFKNETFSSVINIPFCFKLFILAKGWINFSRNNKAQQIKMSKIIFAFDIIQSCVRRGSTSAFLFSFFIGSVYQTKIEITNHYLIHMLLQTFLFPLYHWLELFYRLSCFICLVFVTIVQSSFAFNAIDNISHHV